MKYLNEYNEFIKQFEMVGSNVIFVDKNGNIENVTSGFSSLEDNKKTTTKSVYRIASISKVIVTIGVLKLYEQGLVDLDEDIEQYLGFKVRNPKFPNHKITIRMLMTQTSSIIDDGDFIDGIWKGYDGSNYTNDYIKPEELLIPGNKRYYMGYSDYEPGTNFIYSNFGCGLLACIAEKITGIYFPEYIKQVLLHPLEIYSGFRLEDLVEPENLVSHYQYKDNQFKLYRNYESFKEVQCLKYPIGDNFRGVAGGLYISAENLAKIMIMLMNKGIYKDIRILNEQTVIEMEKVQWSGNPTDPTYHKKGLQMIIMDNFTKDPLYGHFGNAYGLRSFMLYNKNGGLIFLCNGANFLSNEEHMTILQEKVIKFLVEKTNL